MHNMKQCREGRMRDEGRHGKHLKEDGSVPIMGSKGASLHGRHTGEMAEAHTGMVTDSGKERMLHGKRGDHEENA